MIDQPYDFLIAFHVVTTTTPSSPLSQSQSSSSLGPSPSNIDNNNTALQNLNRLINFANNVTSNEAMIDNTNQSNTGKIIHILWSIYDIKKRIVTEDIEFFVKPPKVTELNQETIERTKLNEDDVIKNGTSLVDIINRFNDEIYINFIKNNLSFCLVTCNDNILTKILPTDCKELGIKLPNYFLTFFDILTEFHKFFIQANNVKALNEVITFLKLKEITSPNLGQLESKSILRIIHRLINDGHRFISPKVLNTNHQIIIEKTDFANNNNNNNSNPPKKTNMMGRSKSPETYKIPLKGYYLRLRGLPYSAREGEVVDFFRGIRLYKEDIAFSYDYDGRFTGEAYVLFHNEPDYTEAITYHMSNMGTRYIEIFESNENEWNKAKTSQYPDKKDYNLDILPNWNSINKDSLGIVRMRGLPFSCTENEIREFFHGYKILNDGIKRGIVGGRPSGECYVLFESKEEALRSLNLNMEKIGQRFIELFLSNARELETYMQHHCMNNGALYARENMPMIPYDKKKCTLLVMGLPFTVHKEDLVLFFNTFSIKEKDIYLLTNHNGKFSGNALITFEDEFSAQRALKTKNLAYIGNRYIELYEYR